MRYFIPATKNKIKRLYKPFQRFGIFHYKRRFKQQHIFKVFHDFLFWILLSLFCRIGMIALSGLGGAGNFTGLKVELPASKMIDIVEFGEKNNIYLYLDRMGNFVADDILFEIEKLSSYLDLHYKNSENYQLFLKCDQKAEMQYVLRIFEQVRKSKFDSIIHCTIPL